MYRFILSSFLLFCLSGCASQQALFVPINDASYPARSADFEVQIFRDHLPERPYREIARLNVHMEKTFLMKSAFEGAKAQLENQARACGAEAIIKVEETVSMLNETRMYNVSAVAIVFTD